MTAVSKQFQRTSAGETPRYFRYPEEVRDEFVQTADIEFRDVIAVTPGLNESYDWMAR